MERIIMQELVAWKDRDDRKPLILLGARQVGKTYILKEFGKRYYKNVAYINCDNNEQAAGLFAQDYDMQRIILAISAIPPALLLLPNADNTAKGDFTENFVCSQMKSIRNLVFGYYSKDNSQLELDFVIQSGLDIIPVEVKAEENLQSKSLKNHLAVHPGMKGLRFSMSDYRVQDTITNVPLYGVGAYLTH